MEILKVFGMVAVLLLLPAGESEAREHGADENLTADDAVDYSVPPIYRHHHRVYRGRFGGVASWYGWHRLVSGRWYWPNTNYRLPQWWAPFGYSYYRHYNYRPDYRTYGAIAYSPITKRWGVSYGKGAQNDAARDAARRCGEQDCASVVWARGGCAAVAVDDESTAVFWGINTTKKGAAANAVNACVEAGSGSDAQECQPVAWVCSQ
jgi:hypothetical protein